MARSISETTTVNGLTECSRSKTLIIAALLCALLSGCALFQNLPEIQSQKKPYDADQATLKRGDTAFREGNLQKAIEIYSILSQIAKNKTTRRMALYGLACTKLALAETPAEQNEALVLWDAWSELAPVEMSAEDPRMLRPVLAGPSPPEISYPQTPLSTEIPYQETMNEQLVQSRNNEIKKLKKTISAQKKEIEKLKHQINSLEAIDKDMMQKKKEISTQ